MPARVDAHAHVWPDQFWPVWLGREKFRHMRRSHPPPELHRELRDAGIDQVVLVHAAIESRETAWLLSVAESEPWVLGVVGWVAMAGAERTQAALEALGPRHGLSGIRYMPDWDADDSIRRNPSAFSESAGVLADAGLALDFHAAEFEGFGVLAEVSAGAPTLRIVADHMLEPPWFEAGSRPFANWRALCADLAQLPGLHVKVSGWSDRRLTADMLEPAVVHLAETFGPERLMYGGNWPVSTVFGDYGRTARVFDRLLEAAGLASDPGVLGGNARDVYAAGRIAG